MLEQSLKEGTPIALVYGHHNQQWPAAEFDKIGNLHIPHESLVAIRRTACAGHPYVVQRSDDGSVLVSLEGQYKIWIEKLLPFQNEGEGSSPLKAQAIELKEDLDLGPHYQLMYRIIEKDFRSWVESSSPQLKNHSLYQKMFSTPSNMISLYSDLVIKDPIVKQKVLESDNLNDKLKILAKNKVDQRTSSTHPPTQDLHP
jgi:Lon protease-like protein